MFAQHAFMTKGNVSLKELTIAAYRDEQL